MPTAARDLRRISSPLVHTGAATFEGADRWRPRSPSSTRSAADPNPLVDDHNAWQGAAAAPADRACAMLPCGRAGCSSHRWRARGGRYRPQLAPCAATPSASARVNIYFLVFGVLMGLTCCPRVEPHAVLARRSAARAWSAGWACRATSAPRSSPSSTSRGASRWRSSASSAVHRRSVLPKLYGKEFRRRSTRPSCSSCPRAMCSGRSAPLAYIHMYPITLGGVEGAGHR